jgi:FkbM family methyltransferase
MNDIKKGLLRVEKLANGGKINRFLAAPAAYAYGIFFSKIIYPTTKKGVLKTTTTFFDKKMEVLLPAGLDIYLTGGKTHQSEINLARFIDLQLAEGDFFLDIGAHFGYFSLLAAAIVGEKGKVATYEASKSTFEVLRKNTAALHNINIHHQALSDKKGEVSFYEFPVLFSEYNAMDIKQFEQESWYQKYPPTLNKVAATTIDDIVTINGAAPKIIKIDVEGAEQFVIAGATTTLQNHSPYVVLEFLNENRSNESHRNAATLLYNADYQSFSIDKNGELQPCPAIEKYLTDNNIDSDNIVFAKKTI